MHELISCVAMRRLPSLDSLRVFEAAARHLSLTKASDELHVTQSALSHRIQALEAELGVALFRRYARRIELTPAGEILAAGVRRGLDEVMRALASIDPAGAATSLTISVLPSFATRWLVPRLGCFRAEHPAIDVRIAADPALVDLHKGNADLGIRFGRGRYPGLYTQLLMADAVFPVCSPDFRRRMGDPAKPEDLLRCTLLRRGGGKRRQRRRLDQLVPARGCPLPRLRRRSALQSGHPRAGSGSERPRRCARTQESRRC